MKIQEQDRYHGPALMQIVEHASFKALNRASKAYGHYLVNTDREIFVKYLKVRKSPWVFTVQPSELGPMNAALAANHSLFLCLVCGTETICALTAPELQSIIDMSSSRPQSIRVEVPLGGSCHVGSPTRKLPRAVPHNSFPNKIF